MSPDRVRDISKDVWMNQKLLHNAIKFSNFLRDMPKQKLDWPELYLSNHILNKLSATNYVKSPGGDRKRKQPKCRKQWVGFADKCAIFVSKILQMIDSLGPSCSEIENWDQIVSYKLYGPLNLTKSCFCVRRRRKSVRLHMMDSQTLALWLT